MEKRKILIIGSAGAGVDTAKALQKIVDSETELIVMDQLDEIMQPPPSFEENIIKCYHDLKYEPTPINSRQNHKRLQSRPSKKRKYKKRCAQA